VLFVCENNFYATEVAFSSATKNTDVAARARTYGMEAVAVDGNDVLAVYQAAEQAIARARSGKGPSLIEARTYRTRAHSEGMRDAGYRTVEEIDSWRKRDPITSWGERMVAAGLTTEAELQSIQEQTATLATQAIEFAKNSPYPEATGVSEHIFSN